MIFLVFVLINAESCHLLNQLQPVMQSDLHIIEMSANNRSLVVTQRKCIIDDDNE